jgi:hypothetical protein
MQGTSGRERLLLPDFASAKPPLRMRVTPSEASAAAAAAAAAGSGPLGYRATSLLNKSETLTLQDASGAHSFHGERENLDSHYGA